jgi:hypothetical protein
MSRFGSAVETDPLKPMTQLNIARVLIHRADEPARKWARERAKPLADLLGKHERTNVFADELVDESLEIATRSAEQQAQRAGARDAAALALEPVAGRRAPTAAAIAMRIADTR